MKLTLLVLAAGMGSRYGGLKQMDPMGPNGETVLDYSVFDAIRAGFGKVVFIIREDFAEEFRKSIGDRFADLIEVGYVYQSLDDLPGGFGIPDGRTKPWGTGHAVRAARDCISEPFAVINADDFYGSDAYLRAAQFLKSVPSGNGTSHYAMIGYPLENTLSDHGNVNRGVCFLSRDSLLEGVEEYVDISRGDDGMVRGSGLDSIQKTIKDGTPVSMNFWAFTPDFFGHLENEFTGFLNENGREKKSECYIPTVVDRLIRSGKADCKVLETTSHWFGVTYQADKPHVSASIHKLIDAGEYPASLT